MAKILLLTFTNTVDNYGQVLQAYATQTFLEEKGHKVLLHKSPPPCKIIGFISRVVHKFMKRKDVKSVQTECSIEAKKNSIFSNWNESVQRNEKLHPRKFEEFRNKEFKLLRCYKSLLKYFRFDACVTGSDQTWSTVSDYFFLAWTPERVKRIAIAPSVGHKEFSNEEKEILKPWIQRYDLITVREQNGIDLCKSSDRNDAVQILDPSFLIDKSHYAQIEKKTEINKPYILLYLLGGEIEIDVSEIYKFASDEKLAVVYVASQGREDKYEKVYPEVGEWLNLIRNAKYVITNSFHGMAFSLIYQKQFMVLPLVGVMKGMNGRIYNLKNQFNLETAIFRGNFNDIKTPINWDYVNRIIKNNAECVSSLLKNIQL